MRSILALLVLAAVGGWAIIRHLPESEAQPGAQVVSVSRPQQILSVSLDGRNLPLAALRDRLATKAGDLIDLATLARDRATLESTLVGGGYLAAQVGDARVTFAATGATFVTFPIEAGPMFRIRNVSVTGASKDDAGVVTLGAGQTADASRIALARQALESRIEVRRKQSIVVTKLVPDVAAGVVDVELNVAR